jgi:hypothetical protein
MHDSEQIETVRQAIMRYRELLDILGLQLERSERAYNALFDSLPQDQRDTLPEKQLQREAAIVALEDLEPLRRAVLRLRFDTRDIERESEALYNNIATEA